MWEAQDCIILTITLFSARKIANNLYPLQEIRMEDDQMCIDTFTRWIFWKRK